MKLLYKIKVNRTVHKKGKPSKSLQEIMVPVEIVEGSINKSGSFGRKDCRIVPMGGRGELTVDYNSLVISK